MSCAMVTVPCLITVAAGVFAPGHLGELTRYLPFELVDDVLESTRTVQRRMRALPSRVGIYFVLAMTLFPGIGYLRVWGKMTAALEDLDLPRPSEKALRDLRRRLGPAPVKALFETVAVPLASPRTPGVAYRGLRTVAFDGLNSVKVPDSDRNRSWLGKTITGWGGRVPGDADRGPGRDRHPRAARRCDRRQGRAQRGAAGPQARPAAARRACCCWPTVPMTRRTCWQRSPRPGRTSWSAAAPPASPPVGEVLPDGSYLSRVDGLRVRIIEAGPGRARRRRDPARGQLPADHHAAGLAPLPGRGTGPPLP